MKQLRLSAIVVILTLVALTTAACGQSSSGETETLNIGVINFAGALDPVYEGFKVGMTDLGYVGGEDVTYIYDGPTSSIELLEAAAQDLVDADVDLVLSLSTPATQAVKAATDGTDLPVVFVPLTDPVGAGIVPNLNHPGGNITGVTFGVQEARRLEWLLTLAPNIQRIYVPYNPDDPSAAIALETVSEAAGDLGVELVPDEARDEEEITQALESIPMDVDAIFLLPDSLLVSRDAEFIEAALERGLPLTEASDEAVEKGALMAYSFRFHEAGVQAARIADQILRGASPGDLPVETSEFFLAINVRTADSIGLEIPDEVLEAADTIVR